MNVDEALLVLDIALEHKVLNDVQELVFRQSYSGQTYLEMAEISGYNANYIKDVGYKLWKLLSEVFKEEVTKSNFRSVLRRRSRSISVGINEGVLSSIPAIGSLSVYPEDSVSVPISDSVSQRQEALVLGKEIASGNQIESQQTLVINTVLTAPSNVENININSQNIKTELVTAIPQFINAKDTTAKTGRGLGEAVDVLAFYGRTEKLNLLKQWIMDDHCRLVAVLGVEICSIDNTATRQSDQDGGY